MSKKIFVLIHEMARSNAIAAVSSAPKGYKVVVSEPSRSLDQNSALWPILQAFSEQLKWPVNGAMVSMSPDEWKDVTSAAFRRETARVAMGLDGGVVMLGCRTSKMSKREFSEYLEFLNATAAVRGVIVYRDEDCHT
jgi:hypothetical protein